MIRLLASVALTLSLVTAATAQERVVNVYNWSDYVDPKALDEFTKQTGIKVVYDTYDNNELDETKLPDLANQWPDVTQRLAVFDPGNQFAVNYMWGTTGIGINVKKVKEALGDVPLNTWDLVMKPEISSKLKGCGIYMLDSPEDLFPGVLAYLGMNPDSKRVEDLNKAGEALFRVRGNIQKFHSSEYINALANGDICVAVGYSGDVMQAKKRAEEAKNGVEVGYVI